jgi:ankyrin repeat protein
VNQGDGWKFTMRYSWIPGANALHLATCWHISSLALLLEANSNLKNIGTDNQFTPLHVAAAIDDDTTGASLLIKKRADVKATDSAGQTALHIAAQCGSVDNVMVLLFEGNADVMAIDGNNKTSLHHAKTAKTLDILLNKCQPNELSKIDELSSKVDEDGQPKCLFDHILESHPECIETYLDLMVTCKNGHEDVGEKQYTFEMELFNHGTEKKENFLDHHKKLIKGGLISDSFSIWLKYFLKRC